jgi:LuxR family maltose regulon positive regulatory protein
MNPPSWYLSELAACQVQLWLAQGNLAAASRWAQESNLDLEAELNQANEFEYITLARVLVARGRSEADKSTLAQALGLLERLAQKAESEGRSGHLVGLLALRASALDAQGDLDQALLCLGQALELAEPEGYLRTFVDLGLPLYGLLSEANARGIKPDYTNKLLAAFRADQQFEPLSPPQALVEPLSPRELEVLELIAQGLSNHEICERLFLALSTVKGHNRNIFDKLQVQRRTEAVARARELRLL